MGDIVLFDIACQSPQFARVSVLIIQSPLWSLHLQPQPQPQPQPQHNTTRLLSPEPGTQYSSDNSKIEMTAISVKYRRTDSTSFHLTLANIGEREKYKVWSSTWVSSIMWMFVENTRSRSNDKASIPNRVWATNQISRGAAELHNV